ncbi:MAG: peptidase C39 family protein [Nitrospirae bacterium]|nr:peptidase C39 family protein [Nitrospirota bacterium]
MQITIEYKRLLICGISCLLLYACSTTDIRQGLNPSVIENVPFHPQEDYQCGPASLAGVMNYWGMNITPENIAKDIYSGSARGTLNIDMVLYVNKNGLEGLQYQGRWDDLKAKIDRGYPLIALVDYGFYVYQANHFMVLIGYNDKGVIANSGKKERLFIEKEKFLKIWGKTNFWTLWVKPK